MKKGSRYGIVFQLVELDDAATVPDQAKNDIIKSVRGVVRKNDSIWIMTAKKVAILLFYPSEEFFSSNSQIVTTLSW